MERGGEWCVGAVSIFFSFPFSNEGTLDEDEG